MTEHARTAESFRKKLTNALGLVLHSVRRLGPYDPERTYSADELEPYDALSDRFVRAVEVGLRFFRAYERFEFGDDSRTTRDLLHRMEKLGLVTQTELWMEMRDVRNRIVHDYLPKQIKAMYDDIMGPFGSELRALAELLLRIQIT